MPGDRPFLGAFQSLAFVAGPTRRVTVALSVGSLPYRHPLLWVKAIGTLDFLSGGRFIFGAGVGWFEEEFRALEADFTGRAAAADRVLGLLRELGQTAVDPCVSKVPRSTSSQPRRHPATELDQRLGTASPVPRDRARRLLAPHGRGVSPERVREERAPLRERSGRPIGVALLVPVQLSDDDQAPPWESEARTGSPRRCAELLADYGAAGVEHAVLSVKSDLVV